MKSGAGAPKAAPASKEKQGEKAEKKDSATPRKSNPAPADHAPAAPAPEKPAVDGAADQEAAPEGSEAREPSTDSLENLKPFLIGGAVIAAAAILVGALLLTRRH